MPRSKSLHPRQGSAEQPNGAPKSPLQRSRSCTQSQELTYKNQEQIPTNNRPGLNKGEETATFILGAEGRNQTGRVCVQNKVVVVDGVKVKLQIWDTAGQERFRSVTHAYYRDAQALLLLYDITNKSSFDNIRAWLTEVHEYAQQDVVIMLLGNKADITSERAIKREEGEKLAREYGVPFIETSAKTGINVELAFLAVAKELKHRSVNQPNEPKFQIHDYIESQREKSSCCGFE
ncbi:ras-related protein Rab-37 isoform X2 [Mustelus asterias]